MVDRDTLVERLAKPPPLETLFTSDDLERQKALGAAPDLKPAAVLVLVVNHARPAIVLTERTRNLADHAGQVSFPGGRCCDEDCTPERTALREAAEEIGIDTSRVEILGRLPEYLTSTSFNVTPVVGWVEPPVEYRPDPREVEDVFEVPLDFLLDPRNHRYESAFYKGRMRKYWAMPYGRRFIWGATAGMLVTLQRILTLSPGPSPKGEGSPRGASEEEGSPREASEEEGSPRGASEEEGSPREASEEEGSPRGASEGEGSRGP